MPAALLGPGILGLGAFPLAVAGFHIDANRNDLPRSISVTYAALLLAVVTTVLLHG